MTSPLFHPTQGLRRLAVAACFLAGAASQAQVGQASPESAGTLVYRGATFAQRTPAGDPLYHYERRVLTLPTGLRASHTTSNPAGRVIIVESATLSPHYALHRFEATNQQAGFSGSVQFSNNGRHLEYELNDKGKVTTASEEVVDPVVSGPSLFGFILKHWDLLKAGATVPVRMLVLQDKTTYGFDVKYEKQVNDQAAFTITPSSFLVRMAIAPLRVVFDVHHKTPVRYEGRVPPMENVADKLKNLDARVEYTSASTTYR